MRRRLSSPGASALMRPGTTRARSSRLSRSSSSARAATKTIAKPNTKRTAGPLEPRQPIGVNGHHAAPRLLRSFFAAGFECSTHFRRSGLRLDLIHATAHDRFARLDYARIEEQGMRVAREGVCWHLVEKHPGKYDFRSTAPIAEAARATGTQVIWDLCHFGWPDHLDLFSPEFISSLASYGAAFARWITEQTQGPPFIVPVNEISFFSWASGDEGSMFPFVTGRGFELKRHLVRASIETMPARRNNGATNGGLPVREDP